MNWFELFLIAVGLSMDAFAVSVCKGMSVSHAKIRHALICGLYFGIFQAVMPLLGYLLGRQFEGLISNIAPIVAFILLTLIGINMIRESRGEEEKTDSSFFPKAMLPLAIATSIDALAVGISFAMLEGTNISFAVTVIGITTFILSFVGVKVGGLLGNKSGSRAEFAGGLVLIFLGVKILIEYILTFFK